MTTENPTSAPAPSSLRERAKTALQARGAGLSVAKDASVALRVLFDLAASPATAHDALALLHELQVHQVELDLQNEELQTSRAELEASCDRQQQLHNASPCAQVVLDGQGCLLECNALALAQLNTHAAAAIGKPLSGWLAAVDVPRVQIWLSRAMQGQQPPAQAWVLRVVGREGRAVVAAARINPCAPGVLLAWIDAPPLGV
jgi:PAS domain-containing protein